MAEQISSPNTDTMYLEIDTPESYMTRLYQLYDKEYQLVFISLCYELTFIAELIYHTLDTYESRTHDEKSHYTALMTEHFPLESNPVLYSSFDPDRLDTMTFSLDADTVQSVIATINIAIYRIKQHEQDEQKRLRVEYERTLKGEKVAPNVLHRPKLEQSISLLKLRMINYYLGQSVSEYLIKQAIKTKLDQNRIESRIPKLLELLRRIQFNVRVPFNPFEFSQDVYTLLLYSEELGVILEDESVFFTLHKKRLES